MLVDSHCHLDFPELAADLPVILRRMEVNGVGAALCAGVTLERFPAVLEIASGHENIFAAVGVHPDTQDGDEPEVETLVRLARHGKVVAIGETGLDYYRLAGDLEWQRQRFRVHVEAAREVGKPLIIHTRSAGDDTLRILEEEHAGEVGGVFHCFTEDRDMAWRAIDLGFHVSFSGIVTFKNALDLRTVAAELPLDRLLVETDAPYLAPVPHRGKLNEPAFVRHVAEAIARLRGIAFEELAEATTRNFCRLFNVTLSDRAQDHAAA
ncbi:MAG: TatD family hydrolase [Rhodocyclaceae bacterium]|jgi:TatD DNase family protein|nr:TatD family hydrolase [Rhodocyclaceae bacterium]MBK9311701.1 TatD family hydrolase [Rhodocyclaceae bacterium]